MLRGGDGEKREGERKGKKGEKRGSTWVFVREKGENEKVGEKEGKHFSLTKIKGI